MRQTGIEKLQNYEIVRYEDLPDIHAEGYLLRHKKTGARVFCIPCDESNKVFNIAFRTPPVDSTGVAHIIEHTVLCGSRDFPLKDPFVELVKGSLNTFLNAMTYPDKTMYPVASMNDTDFRNLMNIYLNAVFYPNIYTEKNIFRQEGWHYELNSPDEPLKLSGVVYSEMKGAYSSAEDVLEREITNALFPDTAYGVDSGGDPQVIPTLTYENYLDFHRRYYHPSNSYIYLYGDMDMAETLDFIDSNYLSHFDRLEIDSTIACQKAFSEERFIRKTYPTSAEEGTADKTYLTWNAAAGNPQDVKEMTALDAISYVLFEAPGAPVRQALLDAGIGKDVFGALSDGILQPYFSVAAKNANEEQADEFEQVIRRVITEEVEKGLDGKSIEAALNSREFRFREADYSSYPKGLIYGISIMDTWLYDDNEPFARMQQLHVYDELRSAIGTGYYEDLVRKYLLENPHSVRLILAPEAGLMQKQEQETAERLAAYKASLSKEEIGKIIEETKALLAWQDEPESPENIAKIPVLKRSDIKPETLKYSNFPAEEKVTTFDGKEITLPVVYHVAPSNGIGYLEVLFNVDRIPEELLQYLALLKDVYGKVNTENYSYLELNNEINASTGGISETLMAYETELNAPGPYAAWFMVRGRVLYSKLETAFNLIREILYTSDLHDAKRIREMISQMRSQHELNIQQSGNATAVRRASAYGSPFGALQEIFSGISYYRFLKDLEEHYEEKQDEIADKLEQVCFLLTDPANVLISYTSEFEDGGDFVRSLGRCLNAGDKARPELPRVQVAPLGRLNEGFSTPGQVQYVALNGNFVNHGYEYSGAMAVYRAIMSYEYLWQNVRVRGNAYGCSSALGRNGAGTFVSYRDPHLKRTKDVYLAAPEFLRNFDDSEELLTKYVIGTISGMDTPLTPAMYGFTCMRAYMTGMTEEIQQKTRDEVLGCTVEDIRKIADAAQAVLDDDLFCVIGSESMIEKHRDMFLKTEKLL